MIIRPETDGDIAQIRAVTAAAFAPMPFSNGTEPDIIDALRASGDLAISLVAMEEDTLVGQITFSQVQIDGAHEGWFGLGPVAVHVDRQREGIGAALVRTGLAKLRQMNAAGCTLVGNPDYYERFGFQNHCGLTYGGLDARVIQKLVLEGPDKSGVLTYCNSFERAATGD